MACERCWLSCCSVKMFFIPCIVLLTGAVGFSPALAAEDDSRYVYDTSFPVGEPARFVSHDEFLVRNRRTPPQPPMNPTIDPASETIITNSSTTQKLKNSFDNVAYSTAENNSTKNTTSQPTSATASTQGKPEVIVSQPLNPDTGKAEVVGHPRIWANATMRPMVINESVNATSSTVGEHNSEDDSDTEFGDPTNSTLAQNNITKTEEDTHKYYNSTTFVDEVEGRKYWVDMDNHPNLKINELLSDSHRRAATVKLSFDFPFYGHMVRNVTIATGGFLYTGEYVHNWLAATQYIAPLMANFDTRLSNNSYVKYADNGTAFTVEWKRVALQEKPDVGEFTFQATLFNNGDIVFVYAVVPLRVEDIQDTSHPVKVGLSDAYIIDRTVFFVRRKTIYEYHRVNFMTQDIKNWTVIYLRALPTCLGFDSCQSCLNGTIDFTCKWCPILKRCSTGTDRYKQEWLVKGCDSNYVHEKNTCPAPAIAAGTSYVAHSPGIVNHETIDQGVHQTAGQDTEQQTKDIHIAKETLPASVQPSQHEARVLGSAEHASDKMRMGVSGILGILLVVSLVVGLIGWAGYAYRNPHSASGQVLIRYRPSQWSWRRGEARYTAATIHM